MSYRSNIPASLLALCSRPAPGINDFVLRALRSLIAASALLATFPAFGQSGLQYFPQTIPSGTFVGRLSSGPGPTEAISTTALLNALFPNGSAAFPFNASSVGFQGSVSGAVTVRAQNAAGTWALLWPTSAGTVNSCFNASNVTGNAATASWVPCALLGSNNTYSGVQTFNGNLTVASLANFTGTFQRNGTTQTFPASGAIVGTSDSQTLTNKSIDASEINSGVISASRGGAGATTGALKADGSGNVSQAACANLSNSAPSCSTDTTIASNISSGTLAYARLPVLARTQSLPGNKSITATSATQMMGMAGTITPGQSGNVLLMVRTDTASSTSGNCAFQIRFGTGAAPTNGAAATGSAAGSSANSSSGTGGIPTTLIGYVTGLTPSTAYWIDISAASTGTSITCQALNNTVIAIEE